MINHVYSALYKKRFLICLLAILILGAFFRFYNFPYRYGLGEETIRDAVVALQGARTLQFPLVGSFSSLGPFTFGPWYAYQLILASVIAPFSYTPWIYMGFVSILYIVIMYRIGKLIEGELFGLTLAFLTAISPSQIISATHLTNPNNTNLFAALIIFIFLKILSKDISYWWGFVFGLAIGIGINLHFQMAGFLILLLIVLLSKPKRYLYIITALAGIGIAFLPLLFFELNNHWFNTKNIVYYILHGKDAIYVPNRWLFYLRDFWPAFWADSFGIPNWMGGLIMVLFGMSVAWGYYKKKLSKTMIFLLLAFLFNFILLRYYWGPRFFGYLNFLRPFVFIFTVFTILNFRNILVRRYGFILALIAIVIFSWPIILSRLGRDSFTTKMYHVVEQVEKRYPNQNFSIYTCSLIYKGYYNAYAYSILFLLDKKHKLDENGMPLGIEGDCILKDRKLIGDTGIIDFAGMPKSTLQKGGWNQMTFTSLYNTHARWWFEEKP